jgi:tryptophanyl-tRNA synthetase
VKRAVFEKFMERFGEARRRRRELAAEADYVESVLGRGAARAREVTLPLLRRVREAAGIPPYILR